MKEELRVMNYLDDYVCRITCEEMYRDDYDEEWEDVNEHRSKNTAPIGSYAWLMGY